MYLTDEEKAMLEGAQGEGVRKAMEIVTALGTVYGAERLVPIEHAHVAGVSFKNLGDAGLEFLRNWALQGAWARVPATLNPAGLDLSRWRELGFPEEFAKRQRAVSSAFAALGLEPIYTCTPYHVGFIPEKGQHIAWSESSAVLYANSVLGARTNREGGPGALAAAIVGRTAAYGLHLDENRRPTHIVEVKCRLETPSDYGLLGYLIGTEIPGGVVYLRGKTLGSATETHLKALGAALATGSSISLFHVEGVTPEADECAPSGDLPVMPIETLDEARKAFGTEPLDIDLVWLGCPHVSREELVHIAGLLEGKELATALWITTAKSIRDWATGQGILETIEASGARVVADTCVVVAPVEQMGVKTMMTNSRKGAYFAPAHAHLQVRYGSLEQCIKVAVTGRWEGGDETT